MASQRCDWAGDDPLMIRYHDQEWGVPVHDDRLWFEFLVLEGAQAGLSWRTILNKRSAYRRAFAGFDPVAVAAFGPAEIGCLMSDSGIVRNRLKIESAISNAKAFLRVQDDEGSFDAYMWQWMGGAPSINRFRQASDVPAFTALSQKISKDMKQRGFRFVGPTIMYAHMQATGMVNDHLVGCFRWSQLGGKE